MQRLRDEMAPSDELDRVDIFVRQHPAAADTDRHGDDHRHDDGVVQRHFENHGDGSHGRARGAADHGGHADHGEGRHADIACRKQQMEQGAEGTAERRAHVKRGR